MKASTLASIEGKIRPYAVSELNNHFAISIYSGGRHYFLEKLADEKPEPYTPPAELKRVLWGLEFRAPLMNAAGMDKDGKLYDTFAAQGAGGYLHGTDPCTPRSGNEKKGIRTPFVPYPRSHSASNWIGLQSEGPEKNTGRIAQIRKIRGCPVGVSVSASPDLQGEKKLERLVETMLMYARVGVDFIEVNESCPNTSEGPPQKGGLADRIRYVRNNFIDKELMIPVVYKFSNDTELGQVPPLVDLVVEEGAGGINFGNSSTNYAWLRQFIHPDERKLFDYFTKTFGGGVTGAPLKDKSRDLCATATDHLKKHTPSKEFHVIRTGGIEGARDIIESDQAGVSMNMWFGGYFDGFKKYGNDVYRHVMEEYNRTVPSGDYWKLFRPRK